MWRRGSRCLSAVLQLRAQVGTRRLRWPQGRATLPFQAWAAPVGLRRVSGVGGSELRGAEVEENDVGAAQEPIGGPSGYASSVFSIDYVVSLLRQENAKDICVIQLPPEMKYTDYFVIVSGSSTRHLHAMAHYLIKMYKHMKANYDPHVVIEGKDCEDWLCIDLGNIVVHFMLPETREIYELERLWTLRSHDDQLAQMAPLSLPDDFVFGLTSEEPGLTSV